MNSWVDGSFQDGRAKMAAPSVGVLHMFTGKEVGRKRQEANIRQAPDTAKKGNKEEGRSGQITIRNTLPYKMKTVTNRIITNTKSSTESKSQSSSVAQRKAG